MVQLCRSCPELVWISWKLKTFGGIWCGWTVWFAWGEFKHWLFKHHPRYIDLFKCFSKKMKLCQWQKQSQIYCSPALPLVVMKSFIKIRPKSKISWGQILSIVPFSLICVVKAHKSYLENFNRLSLKLTFVGMKSILANGLLLSGIIESTADCWDPRTSLNQQSTSEALVKVRKLVIFLINELF